MSGGLQPDAGAAASGEAGPADAVDRVGRLRLGGAFAGMGIGLLVQAVGDAAGRDGHARLSELLFVAGVAVIFAAGASTLLSRRASERERVAMVALLGLALLASSTLFNPTLFTGFDDLLHQTTLWQLLEHHSIFVHNSELPVSPYYPGLELLTIAIRDATGAPDVVAELLVVALARLILVLALFRIAERALRSARAAGLAVLVYAASPQFYGFNAAYAYQTLALAFGAAAVCLLLAARSEGRSWTDWRVIAADVSLVCLVVTHHLVAGVAVVFLVCWWAGERLRSRGPARPLGHAALVATVAFVVWTSVTWPVIYPYLRPILEAALTGLLGLVGHLSKRRQLFQTTGGLPTPAWQKALLILSVLVFLVALLAAALDVLRRRGSRLARVGVVLLVVAYLGDLATALSSDSSEVGQRASTFLFFPIALVLGRYLDRYSLSRVRPALIGGVLVVAFAGSLVLGSGPIWDDVPGPYVPAADQRSVDAPSIQAARWAAAHLPVGATIAADRDNGVLMAAIGHLSPVEADSGGVNVGPLYFDKVFGSYDRALIARAHIDYLLVDTRLAAGPPAFGDYFEPGETQGPERLSLAQLTKFASIKGFSVVYRNGPITVYSLAGLGERARPTAPVAPTPVNPYGCCLAVGALLVVLRRRSGAADLAAGERLVALLGAASAVLVGLGALAVLVPVPSLVIELPADALALVAGGFACWPPHAPRRREVRWAGIGLWLSGALAAAIAFGSSVSASAVPAQVSQRPNGRPAALASAGPTPRSSTVGTPPLQKE